MDAARNAIAFFHSTSTSNKTLSTTATKTQRDPGEEPIVVDPSQVIIANGCSGALELALTALLDSNEESILLVPQPGFPLYQVIAESHGARVVHFPLLPDHNWEIDLKELEQIILQQLQEAAHHCDADHPQASVPIRTRPRIGGIVVNNPSNPTGAVYSYQHLQDILSMCDKYHIPVIADEVYGDLTFSPHIFYPMAQIAAQMGRRVPVITASGIGKQFLVPGWRVGWIVFHDK
jgi:tyrosine aminotransferase